MFENSHHSYTCLYIGLGYFQLYELSSCLTQLYISKGIPNNALVRLSAWLGQYLEMAIATLVLKT